MRILIIIDPSIIIPVSGYGGIERIIELLAKEYLKLGHEVHLLVTKGSNVKGCYMHSLGAAGFPPTKYNSLLAIPKAWHFVFNNRIKFDLIHNFGRLLYLLPALNKNVKKIMSYQREITKKILKYGKNYHLKICFLQAVVSIWLIEIFYPAIGLQYIIVVILIYILCKVRY